MLFDKLSLTVILCHLGLSFSYDVPEEIKKDVKRAFGPRIVNKPEVEHYTKEANIFVAVVSVSQNGVHFDMGKLNRFYRQPTMQATARELYTVLGDIRVPEANIIQLDRSNKRKIDRLIAIGEFIQHEELNGTHTDLEKTLEELRKYLSERT